MTTNKARGSASNGNGRTLSLCRSHSTRLLDIASTWFSGAFYVLYLVSKYTTEKILSLLCWVPTHKVLISHRRSHVSALRNVLFCDKSHIFWPNRPYSCQSIDCRRLYHLFPKLWSYCQDATSVRQYPTFVEHQPTG